MKNGVIYSWVNLINNKVYIGKSFNIRTRYNQHIYQIKKGSQNLIHKAIRKHGLENFIFSEICCAISKDYLSELEILLIKQNSSFGKTGYNLTEGGGGFGFKHSEVTKSKMSEDRSGEKSHRFGVAHTEKSRLKMSETRKGMNLGRKASEKTRGILREAQKKSAEEKNYKQRFSGEGNPMFGKCHSEETKAKFREAWRLRKLKQVEDNLV